jgi:hypothetical protein
MLTVGEVAALASRLTGRRCTARQVRYLLVTGGLGTETTPRPRGQTRLYGVIDIALVCLAQRLRAAGVSSAVARTVLTYRRDDIVRAWRAGSRLALVVDGIQGVVQPPVKPTPKGAAVVALLDVWRGLDGEVERVSRARGSVWMWKDVPVHAVPRSTV